MNYAVDKQSFYQMMEELFNNLYGKDFVRHNQMFYKRGKDKIEKNVLTDNNYQGILIDEQIVTNKDNKFFYINKNNNELEQLLLPYVFKYPFLSVIPSLVTALYEIINDKVLIFDDDSINSLKEILKDYKLSSKKYSR